MHCTEAAPERGARRFSREQCLDADGEPLFGQAAELGVDLAVPCRRDARSRLAKPANQ